MPVLSGFSLLDGSGGDTRQGPGGPFRLKARPEAAQGPVTLGDSTLEGTGPAGLQKREFIFRARYSLSPPGDPRRWGWGQGRGQVLGAGWPRVPVNYNQASLVSPGLTSLQGQPQPRPWGGVHTHPQGEEAGRQLGSEHRALGVEETLWTQEDDLEEAASSAREAPRLQPKRGAGGDKPGDQEESGECPGLEQKRDHSFPSGVPPLLPGLPISSREGWTHLGKGGPLCLSLGSRWGADCLENFSLEFPLWRDGISSVSGVPQCRFNTRPAQRVKVKSCHKSQPRLRSEPWPKNSVCRGTIKKEQASKQVVAWGSAGDLPTHCPSPQGQSGKVLHSHRS